MNEYYRRLFSEVKRKDGIVCNVVGDSMLAHWPSSGPEAPLAEKACRAALHIARAAELFNALHRDRSLPTRIGLHAGLLLLDNIGTEDHFEYAPVGDVVNTVSRIEALNKRIGTDILASNTVLDGTQGVASREVGTFLLGGKTQPVVIFELLADEERTAGRNLLCNEAFPEALLLFRRGRWPRALKAFNHCLVLDTEDGPSRFYKELCESFLLAPPVHWKGILQVEK
jgi:adenylate cyclase